MAQNKELFKTGMKKAAAENMRAVANNLNSEKAGKVPVNLVKALGLENISSDKR